MANQNATITRKVKEEKIEEIVLPPMSFDIPGAEKPTLDTLVGKIQTVSVVPTRIPRNLYEQIVIYVSGATLRLYVYDNTNKAWRYSTLV